MAQRGPYSKSAALRAQILDEALRIIGENGYTGATVQEIADAVGMSKPGVLHHFGSRDALLTAVLERRDEVDTSTYSTDTFTVEDLIETVRHNATVPGLVALYTALTGAAVTDPAAVTSREFIAARYEMVVSVLTEAVRLAQRTGLVDETRDPATIARLLTAASDGLQNQWLLNPSINMAADLEALWRMVLVD
jgi:AcrR family transcriptional regulator